MKVFFFILVDGGCKISVAIIVKFLSTKKKVPLLVYTKRYGINVVIRLQKNTVACVVYIYCCYRYISLYIKYISFNRTSSITRLTAVHLFRKAHFVPRHVNNGIFLPRYHNQINLVDIVFCHPWYIKIHICLSSRAELPWKLWNLYKTSNS
jgi:hypothetical protein